jgi:hypothetical protein
LKMKQTKKHTKIIKSFDGYDIARNWQLLLWYCCCAQSQLPTKLK